MDLKKIAAEIPDYKAFQTIDEQFVATRHLKENFPHLVKVQTIGETRAGDPIELISIGEGDQNVLAFGGPHPC